MPLMKIDYDAEYILVYDLEETVFRGEGRVLLPKDSIVKILDVSESTLFGLGCMDTSDIIFYSVDKPEHTFRTHYGYMFALNTPENKALLEEHRKIRDHYFDTKKAMDSSWKKVVSINGPFEELLQKMQKRRNSRIS